MVLEHKLEFLLWRFGERVTVRAGGAEGALDEVSHVPHGAYILAVGQLVGGEDVGDLGDVADAHRIHGRV